MGSTFRDTGYPPDWDERRQFVYQRDGYECQNCGARGGPHGNAELHAHHIVPKSRGGSHSPSNLVSLCWSCHDDAHEHHVPRGDSGDSVSDESAPPSDSGHVLNVENLQHMYRTGDIDFDEFEDRLERSLEERGLQRDSARDDSDSESHESHSVADITIGKAMAWGFGLFIFTPIIIYQNGIWGLLIGAIVAWAAHADITGKYE